MPWFYDSGDLGTDTEEQLKNSVRFLVGDTDSNEQQVQDEEIFFALSQTANNIYFAGAMVAETIQARYARWITSEIDRTTRVRYSDLQEHYRLLAKDLNTKGRKWGKGMGVYAGGLDTLEMQINRSNPLRPPATYRGEFDYPKGKYSHD